MSGGARNTKAGAVRVVFPLLHHIQWGQLMVSGIGTRVSQISWLCFSAQVTAAGWGENWVIPSVTKHGGGPPVPYQTTMSPNASWLLSVKVQGRNLNIQLSFLSFSFLAPLPSLQEAVNCLSLWLGKCKYV